MSPLEKVPFTTFYPPLEVPVWHIFFKKKTFLSGLKNNLVIFDSLFGLDVFSLQSCATGTLLLQKDIYPRKYRQFFTNLLFNAY